MYLKFILIKQGKRFIWYSKDLSVVVESLLKDETIKRALLRKLLSWTTLSQYNVDVDSDENKKILQVLYLNELPSLINDLHLLPNVLNGIK